MTRPPTDDRLRNAPMQGRSRERLRIERVRDATRPTRTAIARSIERILQRHWPDAPRRTRMRVSEMAVLAGDGLLREAFRRNREGDPAVLGESKHMLSAYIAARLG